MSESKIEKQKLLEDKTEEKISEELPKVEPLKEEERKEDELGKNPITNVNIEVIDLTKKSTKTKKENQTISQKTLLEKAIIYRKQNPEKWTQRQKENEVRLNESLGIFGRNAFLEAYYQTLAEAELNEAKLEEQRLKAPGKLSFQLEFNLPRLNTGKKINPLEPETYASISSNGLSIFEKEASFFDRFRSSKDEERGTEPELLITILKGRNLNKNLPNSESMLNECRVKCKFYPDSLKNGPKMKSAYVSCNYKGNSKWNHVFVLKGYTADELASKYVVLEIVGKTKNGKHYLSSVVLAGKEAKITQTNSNNTQRSFPAESDPWQEALSKPGSSISSNTELSGGSKNLGNMMKQELNKTKSNSPSKSIFSKMISTK